MRSNDAVTSKGDPNDNFQGATGTNKADLALQVLNDENLSPKQIKALQTLLKRYEGSSVSSFPTKINDSTFALKVLGNRKVSQESHINAKLGGADARSLISDLKSIGVKLDRTVPERSKAVLNSASNNKSYAEQKTFYADGLASPYEAVNIAIESVYRAKQLGIDLRTIGTESWKTRAVRVEREAVAKGLDEGTATLLHMLTEGLVRFDNGPRPCALYVYVDGRLRAGHYDGRSYSHYWAFGASPSAESK
jgi:hypothetical protein